MAHYEAFLSYAHDNDRTGRITQFREQLEHMLTERMGRKFEVFQDKTGLATGAIWREQIAKALDSSVVLIALITPSFFNREWCRREVATFLDLKPKQGKPAIIIPIYWLDAPLMDDYEALQEHPIAPKVADFQYADWREVFDYPINSDPVRPRLSALTKTILDRLKEAGIPLVAPTPAAPEPVVYTSPAPIAPPTARPTATPRPKKRVARRPKKRVARRPKKRVARRPKKRVARLEVKNAPLGAELTVNGVAVVGLAYEYPLLAGEHEHAAEVVVSALGFRSAEWDVVLVAGHTVEIEAQLEPIPLSRVTKHSVRKEPTSDTAPLTLAEYKAQLQAIPGGSFEREGFTVTLSPFKMGRTPVTVGMWQEYAKAKLESAMPELPNFPVWKDGWDSVRDHPIVRVSWDECKAYADWAGLLLPTEAQWEYAARGGLVGKKYPWGDEDPKEQLWWTPTSGDKGTAPVERINNVFVNGYGLVDMAGNVWQWCADWYGDYEKRNVTTPIGVAKSEMRVLRGGSWCIELAAYFGCAYRARNSPSNWNYSRGFRLSSPQD